MASSDSFVIYIESSGGLNFTVLASSSDNISSLKKKVEAQHLALSPQHGRLFVYSIKIRQESQVIYSSKISHLRPGYTLPDNIPVRCLFDGANHNGILSLFTIMKDSPRTHVLDLFQNDSSDSFLIYINSSIDFFFAVLASSNGNISSLKKKAEAQHLALFPSIGRIVAQAIKIIREGKEYSLLDNILLHCLFDGAKEVRLLYMDAAVVPPDSTETCTHVLDRCQKASSDSYVIYIRSSSHFNFAMLASNDDYISSIKKKAEAHHLALFPHNGRIFSHAINIMHKGIAYVLPDSIPMRCLFDGVKGIHLLFMDAVSVPPDSVETRTHVLDLCRKTQNEKAAAQHLALFPRTGRIVAHAIKITHEGKKYFLPDNIPVHCLFDGANNKGILSLLMDVVEVPLNSTESPTHVLNLCQYAGSDSFVIYIRSSSDLNFAVLASSDDDISVIKKKAAAQHLALFPHDGRIVSQAIKIIHELHKTHGPRAYIVPDDIPVRCLFDVANKGIRLLYMDAVTVPLDLAETRTHVLDLCQNGDPSSGRDRNCSLNQNHGGNTNTRCTSEALKRKSPGDDPNKDPVVAEALKRKSPGDNTNFAILLDAVSADMVVLDSAHEGNGSYSEKENNKGLEKKARKEVGNTGLTTHAGETSSLAPNGRVTPDNRIKQASQPIPKTDKEKMKKSQNNSISATDEKKSHEKTEKGKRTVVMNKYPHNFGSGAYEGKSEDWAKILETNRDSDSPVVKINNPRGKDWFMVRSELTADGKIVLPQKLHPVAQRMLEVDEEVNSGARTVSRQNDSLAAALENTEHPGRVRGVGDYRGFKEESDGPKSRRKVGAKVNNNEIEQIRQEFRHKLDAKLAEIESRLWNQFTSLMQPSEHPPSILPEM